MKKRQKPLAYKTQEMSVAIQYKHLSLIHIYITVIKVFALISVTSNRSVSYTHLDVYKRQGRERVRIYEEKERLLYRETDGSCT